MTTPSLHTALQREREAAERAFNSLIGHGVPHAYHSAQRATDQALAALAPQWRCSHCDTPYTGPITPLERCMRPVEVEYDGRVVHTHCGCPLALDPRARPEPRPTLAEVQRAVDPFDAHRWVFNDVLHFLRKLWRQGPA